MEAKASWVWWKPTVEVIMKRAC